MKKDYNLFLIDLDGTIYRGDETIQTGVDFVHRLKEAHKDYLFLTNNTTRTPEMVVEKLKKHGVETDVNHIHTPSMATASYIINKKHTNDVEVYIIGEFGLKNELLNIAGFKLNEITPEYVVVGMDQDLTYKKVRTATRAIRNGSTFIGTNADLNLPLGHELIPGNGSQCAMIAAATGQQPLYIGKPESIIVDYALKKIHHSKDETIIVGDNYNTDIRAGFNSGVDQMLTLTGVTTRADIEGKRQPTITVDNLSEFKFN